jgi:hypothetical protein
MPNNRTLPTRSAPMAEAQVQGPGVFESWTAAVARFSRDRESGIYVLALLVSISTWFIVIRTPPWLDGRFRSS